MAMATEVTDERLAAIKTTVEKAHRELGEVCSAGVSRRWRMSIPADFTRDSDLIIGDGLRAAHDLAAEVERLRAELARLSAVPAADVERLREALATRERQLSYAVAGMGQGKEGTFFAVKDEAGRVCDVVMAKLSSAHGCVQPAELAPIAASPASGAALNMADFDPTGIELPPELQTSDELARRIAAYALGIGDTAAGVWCTRALSDRMELLGPGGFTMTALLPASPGAIDIMATVQDIADRMNASPPSPAPTGTTSEDSAFVTAFVAAFERDSGAGTDAEPIAKSHWNELPNLYRAALHAKLMAAPTGTAEANELEKARAVIKDFANQLIEYRRRDEAAKEKAGQPMAYVAKCPPGHENDYTVFPHREDANLYAKDCAETFEVPVETVPVIPLAPIVAAAAPAEAYREGRAHGAEVAAVRELVRPGEAMPKPPYMPPQSVIDGMRDCAKKMTLHPKEDDEHEAGRLMLMLISYVEGAVKYITALKGQAVQTAGGVEGGWVAASIQKPHVAEKVLVYATRGKFAPFYDSASWNGMVWENDNWNRDMIPGEIDFWRPWPLPPSPPAPTTDTKGGD
jgi:hypothetical protein